MKILRWTNIVSLLTAFAFLLIAAGPVSAVPQIFTDRASFDAATGVLAGFESFESNWTSGTASVTFSDFTLSETNGNNQIHKSTTTFFPFPITDGVQAAMYQDNGNSIGSFFSFSSPINAFGLDVESYNFSPSVTVGGSVSDVFNLTVGNSQFWGVIDFAGITSISFDALGGAGIFNAILGFDAVSYGVATVPEPSTLLLIGTGLIGLAGFRRKFRS